MGNMMYILILGPMLEEKYGTSNMVFIMLVTALATGLANLISSRTFACWGRAASCSR